MKTSASSDRTRRWRWNHAVQQLRKAYEAAREHLDAAVKEAEAFGREHDKRRPSKIDADYEHWVEYGDHLGEEILEARNSLQLVREGFAVTIYHAWERHAVHWMSDSESRRYDHFRHKKTLTDAGYIVAEGLNKLNKVVNCIKHNSDELWQQKSNRSMFDPVVAQIEEAWAGLDGAGDKPRHPKKPIIDYAQYLRLSEGDMDEFFDALKESGPSASPKIEL
ncbi:hypothetical protein ACCC88_12225 [Sphingomonas sp. Sphisp140]|uniref:hypothetical protein n=1 Tax=unclassified Sphingomonas TaxID=196159 RepID=UPI0039B0FFF1